MDFKNQFTKIITDDSLMETAIHGSEDYPFHYYYENLALFDFHCIDWHWHSELEFVYVESGNVSLNIGDEHIELCTGEGIMINSKILHRFKSTNEAIIPNFLFQPSLIAPTDSLIYSKYVCPVLSSSLKYICFHDDILWQTKVLEIMQKIFSLQSTNLNIELSTSMLIQQLWILLLENINFNQAENKITTVSRTRLQLMMQYIHNHYFENITLEDIAENANISKSTALHLFQDNLKITPVNYLITYRLKQAALLLLNTEKKINTISSETGFNSVDHFCRSFKKIYDVTPTNYRKQGVNKIRHSAPI